MALIDDVIPVALVGGRPGRELGRPQTEAHGAALVVHALLAGQQVDDRVRRRPVELRRVGAGEPGDVARVFDDGALQAKAEPEERDPLLTGDADGFDLALDAPDTESPRHADAVEARHEAR